MGDNPNNQGFSVSWLLVNPNALELAVLREANVIFYWISLSYATLFSIVFFAFCVHNFDYIKNDFV